MTSYKLASTATGLTAILLWMGSIAAAAHAGGGCRTNMSNMSGVGAYSPQGFQPKGDSGKVDTPPAAGAPPAPSPPSVSGPQLIAPPNPAPPSVSGPQIIAPGGGSGTNSAPAPAPPTNSGPQSIAPRGTNSIFGNIAPSTPSVSGPQAIAPGGTGAEAGSVAGSTGTTGGGNSLDLPTPVGGDGTNNPRPPASDRVSAVGGDNNNGSANEAGTNPTTNNNAAENNQTNNNNDDRSTVLGYTDNAIELSRQLRDRLTAAQAKFDAAVAKLVAAEQSNNSTEITAAKAAEIEAKTTLAAIQAEARQLLTAVKNGDPALIQRFKTPMIQVYQPVW